MKNPEFKRAAEEVLTEQAPILEKLADEPTPELTPEQTVYMAFVKKHRDRCSQWARTHGNANFPIVKVGNELVWLNRKLRRR